MERQSHRVSRETRLLLGIVLISLASLWVLARLRFPNQPRNPNPVPPVLAQLAAPTPFEAMASVVADLEAQVGPTLVRVTFAPRVADPAIRATTRLGVRIDTEHAVVVAPPGEDTYTATPPIVASDASTGLAVVRVPPGVRPGPSPWLPQRGPSARFVIAAEAMRDDVSFRPVFVGAFTPLQAPRWPRSVWRVPASTAIADGGLLFTDEGLLAGAVVVRGGERTLVPADVLFEVGGTVLAGANRTRGVPGVAVQEMTPLVAAAVGVDRGLVVAWVDPAGPAAHLLEPLDVVEAIGGEVLSTREQWDVAMDHLDVGSTLELRVRRGSGEPRPVTVTAAEPPARRTSVPLGATFRLRRGEGSEVVRIDPAGAAAHAGLRAGDIVLAIGRTTAPAPAQIARAFSDAPEDRPLAMAIARSGAHLVLAVEKSW
ncbi:MAG: PDZ domain-containing protein [Vicinamibacterales bacterium]